MKDYGCFVHDILETDFPYNNLPSIKNENSPENLAEIFIKLFDSMDNYEDTQKELGKTDIFFKKCIKKEEKIIESI